jgi:branched-chain amino acid transport system permease protein
MSADTPDVEDKDLLFRDYFDRMQRRYLRGLVSPEVIEEHRAKPLGQHSEPLERLLHYFRERPLAGKYAVLREAASYRIVALSGVRGVAPRPAGEERFATAAEAYHGIFLRRIEELMGEALG